jgi:hypothetical protein
MCPAQTVHRVLPHVRRWSAYSPAHRVELTSHAVQTAQGWWIFDPIPLESPPFSPGEIAGILLTNDNHERDCAAWATLYGVDCWAAAEAVDLPAWVRRWNRPGPFLGWQWIPLPGGAPGETAFHDPDRSLLILGDAVVNLPGRLLEILPDKYCRDPRQLRESLRLLPAVETALVAHGEPLLKDAGRRLQGLLGV